MTVVLRGPRTFSLERSETGQRTYKLTSRVICDRTDGPATVLGSGVIPQPGDYWQWPFANDPNVLAGNFPAGTEFDLWAFCQFDAQVHPVVSAEGMPVTCYDVHQTFTTKNIWRCLTDPVNDPLLEPVQISGGVTKEKVEATHNIYGLPLINSSFEQLRGAQVEFDHHFPTIKISQNYAQIDLGLLQSMLDCVNDRPLWGLPARCIKFSNYHWERKYYGLCHVYYPLTLEFEVRYGVNLDGTPRNWDRWVMDEGKKVLSGSWGGTTGSPKWVLRPIPGYVGTPNPNPADPTHYILYLDRQNNPGTTPLDGFGQPASQELGSAIGNATTARPIWVCIQNTGGVLGPAAATDDPAFWLLQNGGMQEWDATRTYSKGVVVSQLDLDAGEQAVYICLNNGVTSDPSADVSYIAVSAAPFGRTPPPNAAFWALYVESIDIAPWNPTFDYVVGDLVTTADGTFLCLLNAAAGIEPGTDPVVWRLLPDGPVPRGPYANGAVYAAGDVVSTGSADWLMLERGLVDRGIWSITGPGIGGDLGRTSYLIGDRVNPSNVQTLSSAGRILVAVNPPANLLLLGIPVVF